MMQSNILRWLLLCVIILVIILVPFFAFGHRIEEWTDAFLRASARHSFISGGVIFALLASDILLPIPSSIVSTGAGFVLGMLYGFLASWLGMTTACIAGYLLGAASRKRLSTKLLGESEVKRLEDISRKAGDWVIVITRAVPVLAETSVLLAGMGKMPFRRFILMTTLSNAAIALVYAAAGALSSSGNSFLLAFCAAILIPSGGMLLFRTKEKEAVR